ncbi:Dam family site-specific DNA-(adenine-N6)-methyltransferase [Pseudoalteromonas sp. OFAV1]|jgi:DNA adenine methylase|uniref:Dam family site-specific DNA-(adenine-N6)-methyltransferase n=1 Tax=Pseudoalteromonas sp. OFAV1 TaxID=2908892 RepID=UPI001F193957|nr:Dam family site-specific DNA-(adenine-N6)-methyltransferase [Pseudoalteromonas sp. OFAV1]MCF2902096.1 Dam family site-specific DNA-(adenine-N6)-methyltransferase [Pseudoalteromonas sp. OFAV1]
MQYEQSLFRIQGSKLKLLPKIETISNRIQRKHKPSVWVEPFMGSGVVGFNLAKGPAHFYDVNPYLVSFFNMIKDGSLSLQDLRNRLLHEKRIMNARGGEYYYELRERFNKDRCPLDFFIINRTNHNGLIRFSQKKNNFNAPYGRDDNKLTLSLIESLCDRFVFVKKQIDAYGWEFSCSDYNTVLESIKDQKDFLIFMDPPYIERNATYMTKWDEIQERNLLNLSIQQSSPLLLTTWIEKADKSQKNSFFKEWKKQFRYTKSDHKYLMSGIASESNSFKIKEAILYSGL